MAQSLALQRASLVELYYPSGELVTAGPGRRLAGYLLEPCLALVTLGIGWFIWFCIVAVRGQTPAKQVLGMYIMRKDGTRAGGGYTWVREGLVKPLFVLISFVTIGILWAVGALWCLWDRDGQCLWDKLGSTYVAWSPHGYRPMTAQEYRYAGEALPQLPS